MTRGSGDRPARVVILDWETLPPETRLCELGFAHEMVTYDRTAPEQVVERIVGADVVIAKQYQVSVIRAHGSQYPPQESGLRFRARRGKQEEGNRKKEAECVAGSAWTSAT